METCFKTYTELYENPFSPQTEIAEEANINRGTVSRTIVKGDPFLYDPVIC
jgi:DNA-binding MarR family transcriptional regulator